MGCACTQQFAGPGLPLGLHRGDVDTLQGLAAQLRPLGWDGPSESRRRRERHPQAARCASVSVNVSSILMRPHPQMGGATLRQRPVGALARILPGTIRSIGRTTAIGSTGRVVGYATVRFVAWTDVDTSCHPSDKRKGGR